jgi:polar amino acid transport system permease protein
MYTAAVSIFEILSFGDKGYGDELFWGFLRSAQIAVFAYLLGLVLGTLGSLGKLYGNAALRTFLVVYTTIVRAVPELVLILLLFYAGQDAINAAAVALGWNEIQINGLAAAIGVLGFVQGAYSTEVIRAAIQAVPVGQLEAAKAFGMSWSQMIRRVVFPAMLPYALPGLGNLWLNATKDTVLISVVGFTELVLATKQAAGNTKRYMLFYMVILLIYLVITLLSNHGLKKLEVLVRRGQAKVV